MFEPAVTPLPSEDRVSIRLPAKSDQFVIVACLHECLLPRPSQGHQRRLQGLTVEFEAKEEMEEGRAGSAEQDLR